MRERFFFRWGWGFMSEYQHWALEKRLVEQWTLEGRVLAKYTRPGESYIAGPIGAVGYYTDLHLYDQYGLTDREVARLPTPPGKRAPAGHSKQVPPEFFFKYLPTYRSMLIVDPAQSPKTLFCLDQAAFAAGRMEHVERYPLQPSDGLGPQAILELHRLVPFGADFSLFQPVLAAAQGLDISDPASAELELARRLPLAGEELQKLRARLSELIANGGCEAPSQAQTDQDLGPSAPLAPFEHRIDVWWYADRAPWRVLPRGAIHLCLPISGEPTLDGRAPGWIVIAPGSNHAARIENGVMAVITLRP